MALLSIYRGTQAEVSERPVSDGALLFATDTKKIYLDNGSSRVEMSSLQDLSNYITSTQLSSAIGAEASARQKQDQLLEQAIDDKLGADDIVAGSNVQVSHDDESGHITISATDTKYNAATTESSGLMSAADKEKLDGIATGANKYTLPVASSSTLGGVKTGANITNSSGTISLTKVNVTNALGYTPPTADTNTWIAFKGASTSAAGTAGYVPAPTAGAANRYFRSDGTWTVPPNTNTTYTLTKSGSTIILEGSDGSSTSVTDANTTYTLSSFGVTATAAELNKLDGVTATATEINYLDGVTSAIQTQLNGKAASSHSHSNATTSAAGFLPKLGGGTTNFLRADGTWAKPPDTNTTYSNMTGATSSAAGKAGLVPAPAAGKQTSFLRGDGTWVVPTNTTYGLASTTANGLLRQLNGSTSQFMRGDGTWATPTATVADSSITSAKLATDAVTSAKIATNAVTADGIAAGAVGTSELASNAVTLAKLGSDVGTVAVQSSTPSDTNVKLWIQI